MYPPREARWHGLLEVGDGHALYYEESGNEGGLPAVYLHGGPGSGCGPIHRQFFDPERFRAVLYDQRGGGRSLPKGELYCNHTEALVADLERLRAHLDIERWLLCGGSWGATLALVYAQCHPQRVLGLVLRGTFLARPRDLDWYFGPNGAARHFPEAYQAFTAAVGAPPSVPTLRRLVLAADPGTREGAAQAMAAWEKALVSHSLPEGGSEGPADPRDSLRRARIMLHYAAHGFFLGAEGALREPERLAALPGSIVHGRCDMVCPAENAWTVHRAWPCSRLIVLPRCGHLATEPEMAAAVVAALNRLAQELCGD